jgi:ankyrin repeat protein
MTAANCGQLEVLRLLLGRGAAADATEPESGFTAFHFACMENKPDCAEVLIRFGCDVEIQSEDGRVGLDMAKAESHTAVVARLRAVVAEQLQAAQAAASPSPDPTPVAVPVPSPSPSSSLSLSPQPQLQPQPELGLVDVAGEELLGAASDGDEAVVARLLTAGADPNAFVAEQAPDGEPVLATELIVAARNGHLEVVRLLLEGGADSSREGGDHHTPLTWAASNGHLEVLRLLLARGTTRKGLAFHVACAVNQSECAEILARAGCGIGIKNDEGETGQESAERRGHKDVVRRLRTLARQQFVGVLVELAGLIGAAEHNGKRATVWLRHLCLALVCTPW